MNKSKIEWCDSTWNPVTGCLRGCEYCYARRIAERFSTADKCHTFMGGSPYISIKIGERTVEIHELGERPTIGFDKHGKPFPFGFEPTLHRYRLDEPQHMKKPQNIFVCSTADLFGDWVPHNWIEEVFAACEKAPQHRYLFLTKNPARYHRMALLDKLPRTNNYWYGSTITNTDDPFWQSGSHNTFLSAEPILGDFPFGKVLPCDFMDWVIIGAMTGPGSKKHQPTPETVFNIATAIDPVFMKDSLIPIVGEENMRREFPWEVKEK